MRVEEIRDHLRAKPFVPFRVFMSDGASYEVPHPELAFITTLHLHVAIEVGKNGIPRRSVWCDPLHVTRIEPIQDDDRGNRGSEM